MVLLKQLLLIFLTSGVCIFYHLCKKKGIKNLLTEPSEEQKLSVFSLFVRFNIAFIIFMLLLFPKIIITMILAYLKRYK